MNNGIFFLIFIKLLSCLILDAAGFSKIIGISFFKKICNYQNVYQVEKL